LFAGPGDLDASRRLRRSDRGPFKDAIHGPVRPRLPLADLLIDQHDGIRCLSAWK
jgi:hypothetical protein